MRRRCRHRFSRLLRDSFTTSNTKTPTPKMRRRDAFLSLGVVFVIFVSSRFLLPYSFLFFRKMTTFSPFVKRLTHRIIMRSMCFASSSSKTASSCCTRRQKRTLNDAMVAHRTRSYSRASAFRDDSTTTTTSTCRRRFSSSSFARGEISIIDHPGTVSYTHLTLPTIYSV